MTALRMYNPPPRPVRLLFKSKRIPQRREWHGYDISIETPHGDTRHWFDPHTNESGVTFNHYDYGYLRLTGGHDGDHVDVYLGPLPDTAENVYVVRQMKGPDFNRYDEDKCMVGFGSEAEARQAYLAHYDRPGFLGRVDTYTVEDFLRLIEGTHRAPGPVGGLDAVSDLHPQVLEKSQGYPVGTVRDWKGGKYKKQPDGAWSLIEGGPQHSARLFSGHRIEGEHGHEVHLLPGDSTETRTAALDAAPIGTVLRVGFGAQQATYRKDVAKAWAKSYPPGKPFQPVADIGADVDEHTTKTGQAPTVMTHSSAEPPKTLLSPPAELPEFERKVRQAEATIFTHPHERALVFDETGKVIFHREGTRGSIKFEPAQLKTLADKTFTHNHPGTGGSFSPADVSVAIAANLREIRACGTNTGFMGSGQYVHRFIRPAGGWSALNGKVDAALSSMFGQKAPASAHLAQKMNVIATALFKIESVKPSSTEVDIAHRVWTRIAAMTGVKYFRNDVSGG